MMKLKHLISSILTAYPETRSNNRLLWLAVLCRRWGLRDTLGDDAYLRLKAIILQEKMPTIDEVAQISAQVQTDSETACGPEDIAIWARSLRLKLEDEES